MDNTEELQDFIIHKSFATLSSKLIRAALHGDWKEAREKRIPLPEAKVADFQIYTEWMYTGRMVELDYYESGGRSSSATLLRLYVLGDYLGDDRFSNAVMDTLIEHAVLIEGIILVFDSAAVELAWETTTSSSKLREVLLKLIICDLGGVKFAPVFDAKGTWSQNVSTDVFRALAEPLDISQAVRLAEESFSKDRDACVFHRHGESDPKCSRS